MPMGSDLLTIIKTERQRAVDERDKSLRECPYDGTRLEFRDGWANCPMGNYRTRRTTRDPDGP